MELVKLASPLTSVWLPAVAVRQTCHIADQIDQSGRNWYIDALVTLT